METSGSAPLYPPGFLLRTRTLSSSTFTRTVCLSVLASEQETLEMEDSQFTIDGIRFSETYVLFI